jgi:hypothetical protein
MASNTTQHPPPPATRSLYIQYINIGMEEGGRVEPERRLEGQQFAKLGRRNTNMTDCILRL